MRWFLEPCFPESSKVYLLNSFGLFVNFLAFSIKNNGYFGFVYYDSQTKIKKSSKAEKKIGIRVNKIH